MKKLITLMTTLSMIMSTAVAFATVAQADTTPTMSVELVNVPETLAVDSTFTVKVTYKNIPTSENEEDWAGVGIDALQFEMAIPGYGEYFDKSGKTYHTDPFGSAAGTAAQKSITDGSVIYGYAGGATADTIYRVGSGEVYTLNLKVLKVPTENVTLSLTNVKLHTSEFDASEKQIGEVLYTKDNMTLEPATITVTPAVKTYTVNFVGYNGADLGSQTVEEGKAATAPSAPAVDGYTFTGWDKAFDNITADTTVTAIYTKNADPEPEYKKVDSKSDTTKAIFLDKAPVKVTPDNVNYIEIFSKADNYSKKYGNTHFKGITGGGELTVTIGIVAAKTYDADNFTFTVVNK